MIRHDFNVKQEPRAFEDLTYLQLIDMIEVIADPESEEEIIAYYASIIDYTLPGSEVSDLILWPEEWFQDKKMREIDLSSQEIANYLLAWTQKQLPGSEKITLPIIPDSKKRNH